MCQDIMHKVAGSDFAHCRATLADYLRFSVKQEVYPAIAEKAGAVVNGMVYFDVPENAWLRLDDFEGDMYARISVKVKSANNQLINADTYVIRPEFQQLLDTPGWDLDDFIRFSKHRFENSFLGFSEIL